MTSRSGSRSRVVAGIVVAVLASARRPRKAPAPAAATPAGDRERDRTALEDPPDRQATGTRPADVTRPCPPGPPPAASLLAVVLAAREPAALRARSRPVDLVVSYPPDLHARREGRPPRRGVRAHRRASTRSRSSSTTAGPARPRARPALRRGGRPRRRAQHGADRAGRAQRLARRRRGRSRRRAISRSTATSASTTAASSATRSTSKGTFTLAGEREEICGWCHGDLSRGRRGVPWASVHAPVRDGKCLACHTPHISVKKGLPADKPPACADCHAAVTERLKTDRFVHGPMNLGDCRLCHTVHASAEPKLLVRPATALCTDCHSDALPPAGHPRRPAAAPDDPGGPVRPLPRAALLGEPAHAAPAGGAALPGVPRGQDPQLPRGQGLLDLRLRQVPRSAPPDAAAPDHGRQPLALHRVPRLPRRGGVHPLLRHRGQVLPLPQLPRGVALRRRRDALPRLPPRQPAPPGGAPRRSRSSAPAARTATCRTRRAAASCCAPRSTRRSRSATASRATATAPRRSGRVYAPAVRRLPPRARTLAAAAAAGGGPPALPRRGLQRLPPQPQRGGGEPAPGAARGSSASAATARCARRC